MYFTGLNSTHVDRTWSHNRYFFIPRVCSDHAAAGGRRGGGGGGKAGTGGGEAILRRVPPTSPQGKKKITAKKIIPFVPEGSFRFRLAALWRGAYRGGTVTPVGRGDKQRGYNRVSEIGSITDMVFRTI
jgi:hypothetical protein